MHRTIDYLICDKKIKIKKELYFESYDIIFRDFCRIFLKFFEVF